MLSLSVVEGSLNSVAAKMNFVVLEFNGEANHVHALPIVSAQTINFTDSECG